MNKYAISQHPHRTINLILPTAIHFPRQLERAHTDLRYYSLLLRPIQPPFTPAYGVHTMTAPSTNQFMTDEYVLAYHGPLIYEARVSCPTTILTIFRCSGEDLSGLRVGDRAGRLAE